MSATVSSTASSWTERIVLGPRISTDYSYNDSKFATTHPDTGSPKIARSFDWMRSQTGHERAKLEASMSRRVQHCPHTLTSYGLVEKKGSSYVITDRLSTPNCKQAYLQHRKLMPADDFFVFAKQALEELARYHQQGLIHRDISLDSMQFDPNTRQLKIFNFERASLGEIDRKDNHSLLDAYHYIAPELLLGLPANAAIDLWSLGSVLFSLYTGKWLVRPIQIGLSSLEKDPYVLISYCFRFGESFIRFLQSTPGGLQFHSQESCIKEMAKCKLWIDSIYAAQKKRKAPTEEAEAVIGLLDILLQYKHKYRLSAAELLELPCLQAVTDFRLALAPEFGQGKRLRLFDPESVECLFDIHLTRNVKVPGCYHMVKTKDNNYLAILQDQEGNALQINQIELRSAILSRCLFLVAPNSDLPGRVESSLALRFVSSARTRSARQRIPTPARRKQ